MTPIYRAQVLLALQVIEDAGGSSAMDMLSSQLGPAANALSGFQDAGGGLNYREVRIATLGSRRLAEQFISDQNLLPKFFPERWDEAEGDWLIRDGVSSIPSMDEAIEYFETEVRSISENRRTGLVTLTIDTADPVDAADWATDLVTRVNEELRGRAIAGSQRSMGFHEE